MRSFLLASFLLISSAAVAQKLNACYRSSEELFCFADDNSFFWQQGGNMGAGIYRVRNDSIILTFDRVHRGFDIQIDESLPNSSNASRIEIHGIHVDGKPLVGVKINLANSKIHAVTDKSGIATIDIKDPLANDVITLSLDGVESSPFPKKIRGYNILVAVVLDNAIKYRDKQKVAFHFREKGQTIFLNNESFEETRD